MKKIELLYFTVAKNCVSTADTWNTYGILFSVEQMTFFCRAVEIPKKSVEQSRFEQLHFEQLTLTQNFPLLHFCKLDFFMLFFILDSWTWQINILQL
jgi:hypothetical protein